MNNEDHAKTESRTLSPYIKGKLGISLAEYSRQEGTSPSTLNDRWNSPAGKVQTMNAVYRLYVRRFEEL